MATVIEFHQYESKDELDEKIIKYIRSGIPDAYTPLPWNPSETKTAGGYANEIITNYITQRNMLFQANTLSSSNTNHNPSSMKPKKKRGKCKVEPMKTTLVDTISRRYDKIKSTKKNKSNYHQYKNQKQSRGETK